MDTQFILSVVNARVVSTDRRFGFTPRFSQFIQDKRAVKSGTIYIINIRIIFNILKKCHLVICKLVQHVELMKLNQLKDSFFGK